MAGDVCAGMSLAGLPPIISRSLIFLPFIPYYFLVLYTTKNDIHNTSVSYGLFILATNGIARPLFIGRYKFL